MAATSRGIASTTNLMYLIGFLDLLGVSMIIPLLSRHARDLGATPTVNGILGSLYGFLQLFSSPMVGQWSDRSGRRKVLLWTVLLSASGYMLLGASTSLMIMFLARIPTGLFKHSQELSRNILGDSVPKCRHSLVFGRFSAASSFGFMIGPVIGGHMADHPGGFHWVSIATAANFLLILGLFKHTQNQMKVTLSEQVPARHHSYTFGYYNAVSTVGFVVGPLLGGHLGDLPGGFHLVATSTAIIFCINFGLVWYLVPPDSVPPSAGIDADGSSLMSRTEKHSEGFQLVTFVKNMKELDWHLLWDIFAVRFVMGFAVIVYRSNFSLMLDTKFQASGKIIGYIISYGSIVGTVSGMFVGRIAGFYQNDRRLLLHVGVLQLISITAVTFAPSLMMMILCLTPLSLATSIARVCVTNLTIERTNTERTGAVLGLGASTLSVARMISPLLAGIVQEIHMAGPGILGSLASSVGVAIMLVTQTKRAQEHEKGE